MCQNGRMGNSEIVILRYSDIPRLEDYENKKMRNCENAGLPKCDDGNVGVERTFSYLYRISVLSKHLIGQRFGSFVDRQYHKNIFMVIQDVGFFHSQL